MPIYEYQCQECKAVQEELAPRPTGPRPAVVCEVCSGRATPIVSRGTPQVWSPLYLEHVCPGGKTFNTKRELKNYCRDHGLASNALL